jgi:cell division protein FtsQ
VERIGRFFAAISALCGLAAFPASAVFDLHEVAVSGNRVVPAAEIVRLAGIAPGESAFRVNTATIRARELTDSRIQDVSVAMVFPRRVTIIVRERAPVAALRAGRAYVLLGADGVVMARTSGPSPDPLLEMEHLDLPWVRVGTVLPSSAVRLGARVAGMAPERLRGQLRTIRVTSGPEVVLLMRDGVRVRLGGERGIGERLRILPGVLDAIEAQGMRVEYVDLRFPWSVIVRPLRRTGLRSESTPPSNGARRMPASDPSRECSRRLRPRGCASNTSTCASPGASSSARFAGPASGPRAPHRRMVPAGCPPSIRACPIGRRTPRRVEIADVHAPSIDKQMRSSSDS